MTSVLELDYDTMVDRIRTTDFINTAEQPLETPRTEEAAGFFETAGLTYQQEAVIGSTITYGMSKDRFSDMYTYERNFNPYTFWDKNKEEFEDILPYIRTKKFHDTYSEQQFRDRAERFREELADRQRLMDGNGWGMLLGAGLSIIDIGTIVPLGGWFAKGKSIAKIGKMALAGGVYSGAQESILHMQQDLRTSTESLINIGFGTLIGGGIGVFKAARDPNSTLSPSHPDNPFHKDKPIAVGFNRMGQAMSESVVLKPVIRGGKKTYEFVRESSVGAAAVEKGQKVVGKSVDNPVVRTLARGIPSLRGMLSRSPVMRDFAQKLYDTGGVITTAMERGIKSLSIEDGAERLMYTFETFIENGTQRYMSLQEKLAELQGKRTGVAGSVARFAQTKARQAKRFGQEQVDAARGQQPEKGKPGEGDLFEDFEFNDLTFKALWDDIDDATIDNLRARFGDDGADEILRVVKEQADEIHVINKHMEDLMVESGMITERQRMGNDYGLAQIYDPRAFVGANRQVAYDFFLEKFLNRPSDEFLEEMGMTFEQFDKLGVDNVKIGDVDYTPQSGAVKRTEVLEEWSGDEWQQKVLLAENEADLAAQEAKAARRDAVEAARLLRKNNSDITKAKVSEARAILKQRVAERDAARLKADKLRLEKEAIDNETRRLEAELDERMNQFHDTGKWQRKYHRETGGVGKLSNVQKLEKRLEKLEGDDPNYGGAAPDEVRQVREMLVEADNTLEDVGERALESAVIEAAQRPVYNKALARLKGRRERITRDLNRTTRQLERLEPKVAMLSEAVEKATTTRRAAQSARKAYNALKKEADKLARQEKTGAKKAKRAARRTASSLPVHMYVEELVDKLGNQQRVPNGVLQREHFASARSKERQIMYTKEERRKAVELGLLRNDIYQVMYSSHKDLSARLAMRHVFGTEDFRPVARQVYDDYQRMIDDANRRGLSDRHIRSLTKERDRMVKDVEAAWKRHLGTFQIVQDPNDFLLWSTEKLRSWNYIKYGTGFIIPSLTDLSTVALTSGFGSFTFGNIKALRRAVKGMGYEEIRRLAIASERVLQNSRTLKMNDVADLRSMAGIGDKGSLLHNLTSPVDRIFQGTQNLTMTMSAMTWWNTRLKALTMIEMQHNFAESMLKYSDTFAAASAGNKTARLEIGKLASIGIGHDEALNIAKMLKKHPPHKVDGIWELEMSRWLDEGDIGRTAYDDVLTGLRRSAKRGVMTPGVGDLPLFMSKPVWRTIMQFQTYGFVSVSRHIVPALQRGATYGEVEAMMSLSLAAGLGTGVVALKDILRSGEIKERSPDQWAYDILDRSGFLMYLTVPSASVYNWAAWAAGSKKRASRYSQLSNQMALIGGPSGGTLADIFSGIQATAYGDMDAAGKHALKLAPFQIWKQVGQRFTDN